MNKILIAYTAGYLDGDGCFYVGKSIQKPKMITIYEYSIQIVSVKKPVLDIFMSNFGGFVRIKPEKERHRPAYCWTIKGPPAVNAASKVLPFLIDKRNQANIFIQYSSTIVANNFKTVNDFIINQRNSFIQQCREDKHMNNLITRKDIDSLKGRAKTVTPSEIDYPYLAGLIDSEGCFRIKKWQPKNKPNEVYAITVEIGNTKLPILPWLIERFGGSVVFISAKANKKASATWSISAAALYEILPKIRPFLTSKQEVCDKLIEFQKTILPNGGDRHSELFRALFEKRREIREKIVKEVHEFNLKGLNKPSSL